jgi:hypothetical protein
MMDNSEQNRIAKLYADNKAAFESAQESAAKGEFQVFEKTPTPPIEPVTLMPCPVSWCDDPHPQRRKSGNLHYIRCNECETKTPLYYNSDEAATAWNTCTTPATSHHDVPHCETCGHTKANTFCSDGFHYMETATPPSQQYKTDRQWHYPANAERTWVTTGQHSELAGRQFGASYRRDLDRWVIYEQTSEGSISFAETYGYDKPRVDMVLSALRTPASNAVSPADVEGLQAKYDELINSVARKFDGETRHETALRYIIEREAAPSSGPFAKEQS